MFNKHLLAILACPLCQGELLLDSSANELICRADHLAYPIVDDIPVMLANHARRWKMRKGGF